jgi:hypothetical protein
MLTTSLIVLSPYTDFWHEYKRLPTIIEMENVWVIGEAPEKEADEKAKAEYNFKIHLLTWYLDQWLPMVVGLEHWGPHIRPYHLMTDKMDMAAGKNKVLVTVTGEAFGLLIYANCRGKWVSFCTWKDMNPKVECPKYNKNKAETHMYKAEWSDSKTGQVKGGGWNPKAYTKLNEMITKIQEFRAQEEASDNQMFLFGQGLVKAVHSIGDDETEPPKKKRKTGGDSDVEEPEPVDLEFVDE